MTLGKCPVCAKPGVDAFRPFCSGRCADVDLHRWLTGSYSIEGEPDEDVEQTDQYPREDE